MNSKFLALFFGVLIVTVALSSRFFAQAQMPPTSVPSISMLSPSPSSSPMASISLLPSPSMSTSTLPGTSPLPSPSMSGTSSPLASPTLTPTPSPSSSYYPTPTTTADAHLLCNDTWNIVLDYNPAQAVRNGQVDFTLTLPASNFGHIPNNPSLIDSYQYTHTHVSDSSLTITGGEVDGNRYTGYILMNSADAVVMKFDLWCTDSSGTVGPFTLVKTYTWLIPPGAVQGAYAPTGTIADIRYVSFNLMIDSDPANDPLGIAVQSQVQLRNLKNNL